MAPMPEKDPGLWAALIAWVIAHQPQLYAAGLSVAIAVFRVMYGGGNRRQMLLEGALCGLITLAWCRCSNGWACHRVWPHSPAALSGSWVWRSFAATPTFSFLARLRGDQ